MQDKFAKLTVFILLTGTTHLHSVYAAEQRTPEYVCEATGYMEGYKGQIYQKKFTARNSSLDGAKKGVLSYCEYSAFDCFVTRCVLEICTDDC